MRVKQAKAGPTRLSGERLRPTRSLQNKLARIMHHTTLFCASGELTRADVPSGGIGVRTLAVRRVRG